MSRGCVVWTLALSQLLLSGAAYALPSDNSQCQTSCSLPGASILGLPPVQLDSGFTSIVGIVAFIAGVASVGFIITAGIKYASSSGDPTRIESAKQTLLYAVIGLIISILAPFIVGFVAHRLPQ